VHEDETLAFDHGNEGLIGLAARPNLVDKFSDGAPAPARAKDWVS
jgi:hypothetical protein